MANEEYDDLDDVYEEESDDAAGLTSGLVITTTLLLIAAIGVVFNALSVYFGVGPMAG